MGTAKTVTFALVISGALLLLFFAVLTIFAVSSSKQAGRIETGDIGRMPGSMPRAAGADSLSEMQDDVFAARIAFAMSSPVPLTFDGRHLGYSNADVRVSALRYDAARTMEVTQFTRKTGPELAPPGQGLEADFFAAAMPEFNREEAAEKIKEMIELEKLSGYLWKDIIDGDLVTVSTDHDEVMIMIEKKQR